MPYNSLQVNQLIKIFLKLFFIFQANGQAAVGQYVAGSVQGSAGTQGLFVKNHAY